MRATGGHLGCRPRLRTLPSLEPPPTFFLALSSLALDSRSFLQKHATELHLQPRAARQAGADQLAHGMAAE